MGEGELTSPREASPKGNNEQQDVEKVQVGKPELEPTNAILTTSSILSGVAPMIVDIIRIYGDDSEDIDTTIPIFNEATI
jgi:hypothetical protein